MGRLQNELLQNGCSSFTEYLDFIMSDSSGNAAEILVNRITTNHTYFMRESSHFDYFKDAVLPYLKKRAAGNDLRIWSAGCSTGEEPYTLAMIIDEFFGEEKSKWDTKILATDISSKVLEIAGKGVYGIEAAASLPRMWKSKYFNIFDI